MKKILILLLTIFLLSLTIGCDGNDDNEPAQPLVRVKHSHSGFANFFGIRFGGAEFINVIHEETTDYKTASTGLHHVFMLTEDGEWIEATTGEMGPLAEDKAYTLTLSGTTSEYFGTSFYFNLNIDY